MISTKLILLSLLAILVASASAANDQPNIIFVIMVDDAGTGDFSNYGGKRIKTPVMARLAKEGMQFNQAYTGSAVCGPTRCVVMPVLHPSHCHSRANKSKSHGQI